MNGCNLNSGESNMSTGDSIERKMDNQLHNRERRNGLLGKKKDSVYTEGNNGLQFWAFHSYFKGVFAKFLR